MINPRQALLARIFAYSQSPEGNFQANEARELAPGVIAVRYNDDQYCFFHDPENLFTEPHNAIDQPDLKSWQDIAEIAKTYLVRHDGQPIDWHDPPISLEP